MSPSFREGRRANTRRTFFGATRAAWMSARARNALRRPVFIAAVSVGAFATALVALVSVPQQAKREARIAAAGLDRTIDTLPYVEALQSARTRLVGADSALVTARAAAAAARAARPDTAPVVDDATREAMAERVLALDRLIDRAENAPLPISYRALAQSPEIRDDPRVLALVDTLAVVERERDAFGAVGGVDPIFVALTSRVNELGRAIQGVAERRRAALENELAALVPRNPVTRIATVQVDTSALVAERQRSQIVFDSTAAALQRARASALDLERRRREIDPDGPATASLLALLAAAVVIGAALGFASAFVDELRRPRVADATEAERVTGLRVLGVIRARPRLADRSRRASDRALPPLVDPFNEGYQLSYLHVATASQGILSVTVTGEDPAISAVVAVNLAAVSAEEARATLLIDGAVGAGHVAATLRVDPAPGVSDILRDRAAWSDAIQILPVGRNSAVDVIPSGTPQSPPAAEALGAMLREGSERLIRQYDTVILVADRGHVREGLAAALPMPLVIYCARVGHTRVSALRASLDAIRQGGGQPVGLVIWDDERPSLPRPGKHGPGGAVRRHTEEQPVPAAAS